MQNDKTMLLVEFRDFTALYDKLHRISFQQAGGAARMLRRLFRVIFIQRGTALCLQGQ